MTVMLQCFGYSGNVMFTEVKIKPINGKFETEILLKNKNQT
jgi:hypothetical protein